MLLGTSNKYAAQRLYGEIHLNEFPVNFMKTGFDINMDSLYRAIKSRLTVRSTDGDGDLVQQATNFRKLKTKPSNKKSEKKNQSGKKRTRQSTTKVLTEIPFSQDLSDALEKLRFKKVVRLYDSLCGVSLVDDPVLAYVGAWTLLESLATHMGKEENDPFDHYYNRKSQNFTGADGEWKNCKSVISEIHKKGNMYKHSGVHEAMNAQQLANDFVAMETFLIHCAETKANALP